MAGSGVTEGSGTSGQGLAGALIDHKGELDGGVLGRRRQRRPSPELLGVSGLPPTYPGQGALPLTEIWLSAWAWACGCLRGCVREVRTRMKSEGWWREERIQWEAPRMLVLGGILEIFPVEPLVRKMGKLRYRGRSDLPKAT